MEILFSPHNIPIISTEHQTKKTGSPQANAINAIRPSFEQILHEHLQSQAPLTFSKHALARLNERNMDISSEDIAKLSTAVEKAESKGIEDTLVLMNSMAFIVNVNKKVVVTALSQEDMKDNVFTNIDGAVII